MGKKISLNALLRIFKKHKILVQVGESLGYKYLPIIEIRWIRDNRTTDDYLLYDLDDNEIFYCRCDDWEVLIEEYHESKSGSTDQYPQLH